VTNATDNPRDPALRDAAEVRRLTADVVDGTPVFDMHTHLFPPAFGELAHWGIDSLVTYHYLAAEVVRSAPVTPEQYYRLSKPAQADLIWDTLFVRNTPISEATRGVVAVLAALGLDPAAPDLREARAFFKGVRLEDHVGRVLERAGVEAVVMTNDPFDAAEVRVWDERPAIDGRFHTALRLDALLKDQAIAGADARRFVDSWVERIKPLYVAISVGDDFAWPAEGSAARLIREAILPSCRDHGLPLAMMIGVRRQVNPALRDAGDGLGGPADIRAVHRICAEHPDNRFLVTMLSRENQHELCVAARKFPNLMPFGCWWFLNNPSIVSEITRERLELLGASFIPQHSDARILEQLIYKWAHSRREIAAALAVQYIGLLDDGRPVTRAEIERDVKRLFAGNFLQWTPHARPA
jgi:hypothetical protein